MSGIPPPQLREKVRKVLESMRGTMNVYSLDITEVRRRDSNFVVIGKFYESFILVTWIPFTITIDKEGNVIEAKIGE